VRERHGQVVIAPTEVFGEFQALRTLQPAIRSQGRGEEAALEILNSEVAANSKLQALLLFEDSDVRRRRFMTTLPERVMTISTGELLAELENAGRIQSSDQILDRAAAQGRNVERQRLAAGNEETRGRLRLQLQTARDEPELGR
jgi:hypothetical protein